jgi:hypothetical protein
MVGKGAGEKQKRHPKMPFLATPPPEVQAQRNEIQAKAAELAE